MSISPVYASLGLSRNPFPPTPDAGSYFFTPRLEEDFAEVAHCIEARKGFVLLTGEVGLGKSTMVRRLLDTLKDKKCRSSLVLNTFLQDSALLSAIQSDFGLPGSESVEQGLARLTEFLIARHQGGETSLLVIDDAQNLSVTSLELVRLLCNLETDQEKLLQILLVGQPELEQTLAAPELRQLKSRFVKHARLSCLRKEELARYFDFRANAAGAEGRLSIEREAVDVAFRATQGNLRQIHLIFDRCLYGLASARGSVITENLVQRAVSDLPVLENEASHAVVVTRPRSRWAWIAAGLLAGMTATVAVASWGLSNRQEISASGDQEPDVSMSAPVAQASAPTESLITTVNAKAQHAIAAPMLKTASRQKCEEQLKKQSVPARGETLKMQRLPQESSPQGSLKAMSKVCLFTENNESWVAWWGPSNAHHIIAGQIATRNLQLKLKGMGFLDVRELDDGLFGPKTAEALARFQQQQGFSATGKPDDLIFFLLEHPHVSAR